MTFISFFIVQKSKYQHQIFSLVKYENLDFMKCTEEQKKN